MIILLVIVAVLIFCCFSASKSRSGAENNSKNPISQTKKTMRCPNCGAQAEIHGGSWRCNWCGDSGFLKRH